MHLKQFPTDPKCATLEVGIPIRCIVSSIHEVVTFKSAQKQYDDRFKKLCFQIILIYREASLRFSIYFPNKYDKKIGHFYSKNRTSVNCQ